MTPGEELLQSWRWEYVFLSFVFAWLGSAIALQILKQRSSNNSKRSFFLLIAGSFAFGAIGVFTMHFSGMNALMLRDPDNGQLIAMYYAPIPTVFSLVIVVVVVAIGFFIVGNPLEQEWWRYVFVNIAGSAGVLVMHYLGMYAMVMQAEIHYNIGWVSASVIIGLVVLAMGLIIFFRLSLYWRRDILTFLLCSLLLAGAVMGVHYSGMAGASYVVVSNPPDVSGLPSSITLFYLVASLGAAASASALLILGLQYKRLLQNDLSKLHTLVLNIALTNSNGQILCTSFDTLPSAIIERAYQGAGIFDKLNGDFLRMLKVSLSWSTHELYRQFLVDMRDKKSLSAYSLQLHDMFVSAAQILANECAIDIKDLGPIFWEPSHNSMITIVCKINNNHSDRIAQLTALNFLPQSRLNTFLSKANLSSENNNKSWLNDLLDYYDNCCTSQPFASDVQEIKNYHKTPNFALTPIRGASIQPMPQDCISMSQPRLLLGLYLVKVHATGLQVLVRSDGPYHHIPVVEIGIFGSKEECFIALPRSHVSWLKTFILGSVNGSPKNGNIEFGDIADNHAVSMDDTTFLRVLVRKDTSDTSRRKHIKAHALSSSSLSDYSATPLGVLLPNSKINNQNFNRFSYVATHELEEHLGHPLTETENSIGLQAALPLVEDVGESVSEVPEPANPHDATDINVFKKLFSRARTALATLLGSSTDLSLSNLNLNLVPYGQHDLVLPFAVTTMSSHDVDHYTTTGFRFVNLKTFEILHYASHTKAKSTCWIKNLLQSKDKLHVRKDDDEEFEEI